MSAAVVWLDHAEAKIFHLEPSTKPVLETLEASHHNNHTTREGNKQHDKDKFFHAVAVKLDGIKEILLIGPGVGKQEFRHHLEKHHHEKLAKAVVGIENADHPTEPQILALARKFFKSYDLYSGT